MDFDFSEEGSEILASKLVVDFSELTAGKSCNFLPLEGKIYKIISPITPKNAPIKNQ